MTMPDDAQAKIETYLGRLRARLRGLRDEDVREIVEELRSHIEDKAATGGELSAAAVDGALAGLGTPEQLASEYLADELLKRAQVSGSPWRVLGSLFRWGCLSVAGFFVLLGAVIGYLLGFSFILCGLLKPLHPHTAGLWLIPAGPDSFQLSLRLGFGSIPAGSRDLLGWWIVPIGLGVGGALVMLTTRCALWCARQYRRSRALPR
jgi:hypothetical protein